MQMAEAFGKPLQHYHDWDLQSPCPVCIDDDDMESEAAEAVAPPHGAASAAAIPTVAHAAAAVPQRPQARYFRTLPEADQKRLEAEKQTSLAKGKSKGGGKGQPQGKGEGLC